ncbi:MAG: hypothetical protein LBC53_00415, partial [Spirochaetaceae bacterium]|nr:hypothetical protein [Spirochaetaceae bacterium]
DAEKNGFSEGFSLTTSQSKIVLIKITTFDGSAGVYVLRVARAGNASTNLAAVSYNYGNGAVSVTLSTGNVTEVRVPYFATSLTITAANGAGLGAGGSVSASPTSLSWTSKTDATPKTVQVSASDSVGANKTYTLIFAKKVFADGGVVSFIENSDGTMDELHTFTSSTEANLVVYRQAAASRILVIGGGGGGGGASYPSSGGGGGGFVGHDSYTFPVGAYKVSAGAGGSGGSGNGPSENKAAKGDSGSKGGDSYIKLGSTTYFLAKGGGYGGGHDNKYATKTGGAGGSGGGGGSSAKAAEAGTYQSGGFSYGYAGGYVSADGDYAAGGGGAGGAGGYGYPNGSRNGAGRASNITGSNVTYAKGGPTAPDMAPNYPAYHGSAGPANSGNGGQGGWNGNGGAGGSGIVVVRFKHAD